jgi:hypothetical protein
MYTIPQNDSKTRVKKKCLNLCRSFFLQSRERERLRETENDSVAGGEQSLPQRHCLFLVGYNERQLMKK